jgi:hypothetical protein
LVLQFINDERSNLVNGEHNVFVLKSNSHTVGLNVHILQQ